MTIADKFDIMYKKPVTDKVINFANQLLKRISFQVNDMQYCRLVPVEKDGSWVYSVRMRSVLPHSCQIRHTGTQTTGYPPFKKQKMNKVFSLIHHKAHLHVYPKVQKYNVLPFMAE